MRTIPTWFVLTAAGVFGLIIGSFLNVVIWRVANSESLLRPGSHCPHCKHPIRPWDNIPLLSWFILGGHCRDCYKPISTRYPLVEFLTGVLFVLPPLILGLHVQTIAYMLLGAGLLTLSAIDIDTRRLPTRVVYVVLGSQVLTLLAASAYYHRWNSLEWALISAAWASAMFWVLRVATHGRGMGKGDVRLAFLVGFSCGWLGLLVPVFWLLVASASGVLGGFLLLALGKVSRRSRIPFGPYMSLGAILAVLYGAQVVHWWSTARGVHS